MKRSNSHLSSPDPNAEKTTDQKPVNDGGNFKNEFEAPAKRLFVKTESYAPERISTNHWIACQTNNQVPNDIEKVVTPAFWPPSIMMKKSLNFEADLKLIDEKFGRVRRQNAGIFIRFFPDTYDMHRELVYFLAANNLRYLTPRRIKVVITGLPCDTGTQQVKVALIEKGLDVEEVFQQMDWRTKTYLPLFRAVLLNCERNKKIFDLTQLLNFNISVGRIGRSRLRRRIRRRTLKSSIEYNHGKGTPIKSEADVPKRVNCGETSLGVSSGGLKKLHETSRNNFSQPGTSYANMAQAENPRNETNYQYQLSRTNNMDESIPVSDSEDIFYIMQEFRNLFGRFKDAKNFAQKLRNAEHHVEKFHLFSRVFLD